MSRLTFAIVLLASMLLAGCSIPVTPYEPSYNNVQLLKTAKDKVKVAPFTATNSGLENISVRGNSFESPYSGSMVNYFETALRLELEKAGLTDPNGHKVLTAVVDQNDVTAGADHGDGTLGAKVTISENGTTLFAKHVQASMQWDSSFIGAIAIPNAAAAYPKLVKKFLHQLFADPDFIAALNHSS